MSRTPLAERAANTLTTSHVTRKATYTAATDRHLQTALDGTLSPIGDTRESSAAFLADAEKEPLFAQSLLEIVCDVKDVHPLPRRLAASTTLKNFVKNHWHARKDTADDEDEDDSPAGGAGDAVPVPGILLPEERAAIQAALLEGLLASGISELRNMLAETFRLIVNVGAAEAWPTVVTDLAAHLKASCSAQGKENSPRLLENIFTAVFMLVKKYQYFDVNVEGVPPQLEAIAEHLLTPLTRSVLHPYALATLPGDHENAFVGAFGQPEKRVLVLALRIIACATTAYMPAAAGPLVPTWLSDAATMLTTAVEEASGREPSSADESDFEGDAALDIKICKRALQLLHTYQTRHRAAFKPMVNDVMATVLVAAQLPAGVLPVRIIATVFDMLAAEAESAAGWTRLSPDLDAILHRAVFPALAFSKQAERMWEDDDEEFIRAHVDGVCMLIPLPPAPLRSSPPPTAAGVSDDNAFKLDSYSVTKSASHLLHVLATQASQVAAAGAGGKPRKGRKKKSKAKPVAKGVNAVLVALDSLREEAVKSTAEGAAVESPTKRRREGAPAACPPLNSGSMYACLMAYAALGDILCDTQPEAYVQDLVTSVVIPICRAVPTAVVPACMAAALCLLSKLAPALPPACVQPAFDAALPLVIAKDVDGIPGAGDAGHGSDSDDGVFVSWRPVRTAASMALREVIDKQFTQESLKPHLEGLVARMLNAGGDDDDDDIDTAELPLSLMSLAVAKAGTDIVPFAAGIMEAMVARCKEDAGDGMDLGDTGALEALSTIVETVVELGEDAGPVATTVVACVIDLITFMYAGEAAGPRGDTALGSFTADMAPLLSFVVTQAPPEHRVGVVAMLRAVAARVGSLWDAVSEYEEAWDAIIAAMKFTVEVGTEDDIVFIGRGFLTMAGGMVENGVECGVRGGCRIAIAILTAAPVTAAFAKLDTATVHAFARGVAEAVAAAGSGALDCSVLAFCVAITVVRGLPAELDAECGTAILRRIAKESQMATESECAAGPWGQLVLAALFVADAAAAGTMKAYDSSKGRRAVASMMTSIVDQVTYVLEHPEAKEEEEEDDAEVEESDEEEEEAEEEEEDEDEEGDDEEEDDEAFYSNYAARHAAEDDEEEEEEEEDGAEGFGAVAPPPAVDVVQVFREWVATNMHKEDVSCMMKRSAVAAVKARFA